MKVYFSGIGGVGIGPLALIAHQAGLKVDGSDREESLVTKEIAAKNIPFSLDQSGDYLRRSHEKSPIDWFVYTAALPPNHPELLLAQQLGLKVAKRDELLAHLINQKGLKLIAVAGTHGKTSTTGLLVWVLQQLSIPVSYSVGTTLSFGPSGAYHPDSEYFIYECDEFDRNFLHFSPHLSLITNIDYDHPDTFPTQQDYFQAFATFIQRSNTSIMWQSDTKSIQSLPATVQSIDKTSVVSKIDQLPLAGRHNRENAYLALQTLAQMDLPSHITTTDIIKAIAQFPGTNRRFERLADNLYSDYGHHPKEIAATLQMASELSNNVTLVYQPHQNQRQHEISHLYTNDAFRHATTIYWLPTYLTRENNSQRVLSPAELTSQLSHPALHFAQLDEHLWQTIDTHRQADSLVLCMGAGTIDAWLRQQLQRN